MVDSAALLVDEILPHQPMRQWVLSVPFPLRFLFASNPRVNLIRRFHGVFAPNSNHRAQVTPAKRGKVKKTLLVDGDQTPAEHRAAMTWARRLKRVFRIDIETCKSAVVMPRLSPVSKTQWLFRRYLPTWMTTQLLQ